MDTPREYRQRAADCFRLANEASDVYVEAALTELAIEFRKMATPLKGAPLAARALSPDLSCQPQAARPCHLTLVGVGPLLASSERAPRQTSGSSASAL